MTVPERLFAAMEYFECAHGERPGALYLGQQEYLELREWAMQGPSTADTSGRSEFNGVEYFVVNRYHHLNVAGKPI